VLWKNRKDMVREWANIDPVIAAGQRLATLNNPLIRTRPVLYSPEARRTVVVMPFLGGAMGAGHSKLSNRYVLCWTVYTARCTLWL
jgi:Na+/citrate or Na+/malate symporter